jgi:vitamin B12 transporter
MKKLIVFILLFLPFALISQTLQIQGIITDSINKKPVPYSTIVIKNHNDSTITGTLGDEKGEFSCSFKKPDNYKLVISNVGYKEKTVFFDDEKNSNKHDFGVIELSPIIYQLSETQVTASRPYMQQKFDRKVFSVGNIQAKSARTILDLLKTLPGVVVDEDGSVYYKGADIIRLSKFFSCPMYS